VDSILRLSVISFLRCRVLALGGLSVALALPCFADKVGDIVTGEIVSENEQVLVLKKDPCDPNSTTVAFSSPWKKRKMAMKTCPDKSVHNMYSVEQLQGTDVPDPGTGKKGKPNENDKDRPKEETPKPPSNSSQAPQNSR
jgi:hypothetical protein